MRADSVAVVLAACLPVGLCDASSAAPQCAVDCASSIRNEKGSLDLKVICGDKLMINSLFQCLIGSCSHDVYGPAVAHVVLACSDLGMSIGPLHPVEVQHANLEKPQYLPTPSLPAAYSTPTNDPSQQGADHLTLAFDISFDLKCNSGSDGLVTVSLPPPVPSTPCASPSPPTPNPGNGDGEGENSDDDGGNAISSVPTEQTKATAHPSATSSCPPDSAPSSVQDPSGEQAPPKSTDLGGQDDPAVTSAPSPTSPDRGDPEPPTSASPCSTVTQDTGGPDPQQPEQSDASPSSTCETPGLSNGVGEPEVSTTSKVVLPAPVSPTPAPASSTCLTTDHPDMSVDPIPGPQLSQTAEPTTAAQPSPPSPPSSSIAATSLEEQEPMSTIHSVPQPPPPPPPPPPPSSYGSPVEVSISPPEYAPSGSNEQPPNESPAIETSLPESNTEPLPQENPSSKVQVPSYGQVSLTAPADALAVETAGGKPTGKTAEPSEITLWPTATTNRTSCTANAAGHTTCAPDGKRTAVTVHPPRSDSPAPSDGMKDNSFAGDVQQDESVGSVMVKIIRPGASSAETMLMTLWENAPSATAASKDLTNDENRHAPAAQLGIGSSSGAESIVDTGHDVVSSSSPTQTSFATLGPKPASFSVQSNDAATETSLPRVALVNSDSKSTPHLCTIVLLILLINGILMS
ncbi:hypothetical protein V8C37DRAFT_417351 [Trichoderma ceciliae]